MAYALFGVYLIIVGLGLLVGDGYLEGAKLPINFGEYKNPAGCLFLLVGAYLFRLGIRRENERQK